MTSSAELSTSIRYLLIQIRDDNDPVRQLETDCFRLALNCDQHQLTLFDLIEGQELSRPLLDQHDIVLIGGSGRYSVVEGGPWWPAAEQSLNLLVDLPKPTFGSCWGFQALARALGGDVVTDPSRAELGTITVNLTSAGQQDPLFAGLPMTFNGHSGHQDIVEELPASAVCLASSSQVAHQALRFRDKPIYGTQFHPELTLHSLVARVRAYPQYVDSIAGMPLEEFVQTCEEAPESGTLLRRFVEMVCA